MTELYRAITNLTIALNKAKEEGDIDKAIELETEILKIETEIEDRQEELYNAKRTIRHNHESRQ